MKLRAPQGCASIFHDGRIFVVADDGSIDVPKPVAASLAAHGFAPWGDDAAAAEPDETEPPKRINAATLTRAELFAFLRKHGVQASRRDTNVKLRAAVRAALKAQATTNRE